MHYLLRVTPLFLACHYRVIARLVMGQDWAASHAITILLARQCQETEAGDARYRLRFTRQRCQRADFGYIYITMTLFSTMLHAR